MSVIAPSPAPVSSSVSQETRFRPCPGCGTSASSLLFESDGYQLKECRRCSLAYVANPPTQEELAHLYSFQDSYHQEFAWNNSVRAEFLKRGETYLKYLLPHRTSGRILDLGCSAGFFLKTAQDAGFDVTGLEFSADTAQLGKDLYGLDIHCGTIHQHDFAPESFSIVTLWDVIEHVVDPLEDLRQIADLLEPGGLVAMSTPNIKGLYPRVSYQLYPWLGFWSHPTPPYHLTQFSSGTLSAMCRNAGFEVIDVHSRRIPLTAEMGSIRSLLRSPKRLLYTMLMAPVSYIGSWLGMGDETVLIARKTC